MENFILETYLDDINICDELIEYHKSGNKYPGATVGGVNKEIKDSTDCRLVDEPLLSKYIDQLEKVSSKYIELFPSCNLYSAWGINSPIVIQHYAPGQGFKSWHTERCNTTPHVSVRHLVFMTYLNDVTDQGGTEFMNQKIITTARKGKTLIWPADWTHTHRGVVSPTQDKYVLTGWFSFMD